MKKLFLILFLSVLLANEYPVKYYQSMDQALQMFKESENEEQFLKTSNYFYRISQVIKTDWLSSYYYAFSNAKISMLQEDSDIKEQYIDKAFEILAPFDTLDVYSVDSLALSEIYSLKAMLYVAKIFINPMINGMKYGPLAGKSINKARAFYDDNPRPYFLDGQSKFYTPSAFGGGVDKALPLFNQALDRYKNFEAKKYWPDWGQEDCQILYDKAINDQQ